MKHFHITKKSVKQSPLISVLKKKSVLYHSKEKDASLKVQIKNLEP